MGIETFKLVENEPRRKVNLQVEWHQIQTSLGIVEPLRVCHEEFNKPWIVFATLEDFAAYLVTFDKICRDLRLFFYTYQDVEKYFFSRARNKTISTVSSITKVSGTDIAGNRVTLRLHRNVGNSVGNFEQYQFNQTLQFLQSRNLTTSYLSC